MTILNCLNYNILSNLHFFSISIIEIINVKFILLTSSILGILSLPVYFSGVFKKGVQTAGKAIGAIATGGAAYIGSREIYRDLKETISDSKSGSNSGNSGSNSGNSGKSTSQPKTGDSSNSSSNGSNSSKN